MSACFEVDTSPVQKRRRYSDAYRRGVVAETWRGDASVSEVARRHDLNTNLVFKWRQRYRREAQAGSLIPIHVTPPSVPEGPASDQDTHHNNGRIDMTLASGHRLTLAGDVAPELARVVLGVLR